MRASRTTRATRALLVGALVGGLLSVASWSGAAAAPVQKYKIMVLGEFSSPLGLDFDDIPKGAKAAAQAIKKAGGPAIQVLVCDIEVDANKAAECARDAVDEGVVAVVGAFTTFANEYVPVLAQAGIPTVAPYAIGFDELMNELSFPIGGGILSGTAGMGAIVGDETKAKTIDVSYLDVPGGAGAFAAELVSYATTPRGLPKPTQTPEPVGGADLTPSVQATIDKDTDAVVLATVDPELSKWVLAYKQAGGDALLTANGANLSPTNLDTLGDNIEGMYVSNNYKPASLKRDPGVRQMVKEIKAYDPGVQIIDQVVGAWAGTHLVADALEGAATTDAAALVSALNQDKDWDLGVIPPINFTKPSPEIAAKPLLASSITRLFNIDVYYARVKNGKIKAIDPDPHNPLLP